MAETNNWIREYNDKRRKQILGYKHICPECGYTTGNQAENFYFCPVCGMKLRNTTYKPPTSWT